MKENKIDIKELFTSLQSQMQGILATNSKFITHPGSEGDSLENAWIDLLRNYLPNRYSVDKAMVIDHKGNVSQQIDIVIYDNWYTPFIFNQNGFKYIPAEGVYAVFEVKPDIGGTSAGKHNIVYAGEKVASVRRLMRTSTHMINSGQKYAPRPLTKIIGGILGTNCSQKEDTVEKHIKELSGFYTLEMGCIPLKTVVSLLTITTKREKLKLRLRISRIFKNTTITENLILSNSAIQIIP